MHTTARQLAVSITLEISREHGNEYRVTVEPNTLAFGGKKIGIDDLGLDDWYWDDAGCWLYPMRERRFVEEARKAGATVTVNGPDPFSIGKP